MSVLSRLLDLLHLSRDMDSRRYELDESLQTVLMDVADQEQRPEAEVHADLIAAGLAQRASDNEMWRRWEGLSPREKKVAALSCTGFTNKEIAAELHISPTTVKGYVHQVLVKLQLHSKDELKMALRHWDFR